MSLRDKLSVADIRVLEDVNINVRRWSTEVRDLINHLMELAQANRESEDKPEPTAEKDGGGLSKYATGQTVLLRPVGSFHKIKSICYRGNKFIYTMESGLEFEENVLSPLPESVPKIELTPDWQSYRMELAAKIAVAYAEKGRYEPCEIGAKAVEVANGVINGLKNSDI